MGSRTPPRGENIVLIAILMHKCVGSAGPYGGVLAEGRKKPSIYCIQIEVAAEPVMGSSMWQNMTFLFEGSHTALQ